MGCSCLQSRQCCSGLRPHNNIMIRRCFSIAFAVFLYGLPPAVTLWLTTGTCMRFSAPQNKFTGVIFLKYAARVFNIKQVCRGTRLMQPTNYRYCFVGMQVDSNARACCNAILYEHYHHQLNTAGLVARRSYFH